MILFHVLLALSAATLASADTLINTLQQNGFSDFASIYQDADPSILSSIDVGSNFIIYATNNTQSAVNSTLGRRRTTSQSQRAAMSSVQNTASSSKKLRFKRQQANSPAAVFQSLLSDPDIVNLGPGVNQSLVEKPVGDAGVPTVFAGAGKAVPVVGDDIPFDAGVIRPVASLLEIPGAIPSTLSLFPNLSNLTALLTQSNLTGPVSETAGITVLAPEDSAFAAVNISALTDEQIVGILSQHVIVNYVGYSPLLKDGQVLNTLANDTITVAVRDSGVYFNGAKVTASDVIVENGVVHTVASLVGSGDGENPPATGAAGRVGLDLKTLGLGALSMAVAALF
ncbi:FAS1 domain-containing protein [Neurospora hispaniola]|uniref:FAS1 domain-containing protein n=1 Tax=Neurospora hispaniola TaxID=588809 RepID=A0AAJ0HZ57_9PEZI|nr:FAS1 domain-containing protein [Neurospora hispaniola]